MTPAHSIVFAAPWPCRCLMMRQDGRSTLCYRIFTKGDLSEGDLATTTFSMTFVARGYSGANTSP